MIKDFKIITSEYDLTFQETLKEVMAVVDTLCESRDYFIIDEIATHLHSIRPKEKNGIGCLRYRGGGVYTWVKTKLKELDALIPCSGQYAIPENFVTAVLHCEAWDREKYGSPYCERIEDAVKLGESRSIISKLVGSNPINKTAMKVSKQYNESCPYCNKYFINPAAMSLHIKQSHPIHDTVLGCDDQ